MATMGRPKSPMWEEIRLQRWAKTVRHAMAVILNYDLAIEYEKDLAEYEAAKKGGEVQTVEQSLARQGRQADLSIRHDSEAFLASRVAKEAAERMAKEENIARAARRQRKVITAPDATATSVQRIEAALNLSDAEDAASGATDVASQVQAAKNRGERLGLNEASKALMDAVKVAYSQGREANNMKSRPEERPRATPQKPKPPRFYSNISAAIMDAICGHAPAAGLWTKYEKGEHANVSKRIVDKFETLVPGSANFWNLGPQGVPWWDLFSVAAVREKSEVVLWRAVLSYRGPKQRDVASILVLDDIRLDEIHGDVFSDPIEAEAEALRVGKLKSLVQRFHGPALDAHGQPRPPILKYPVFGGYDNTTVRKRLDEFTDLEIRDLHEERVRQNASRLASIKPSELRTMIVGLKPSLGDKAPPKETPVEGDAQPNVGTEDLKDYKWSERLYASEVVLLAVAAIMMSDIRGAGYDWFGPEDDTIGFPNEVLHGLFSCRRACERIAKCYGFADTQTDLRKRFAVWFQNYTRRDVRSLIDEKRRLKREGYVFPLAIQDTDQDD